MSSNSNLHVNRITSQTVASNFFQGTNAEFDYLYANNIQTSQDIDINGNLVVNGLVTLTNTTDVAGCTGTQGALVVAGGVAINKGLYVGGTGCFGNDVDVHGDAYFNNDVEVSGFLDVLDTTDVIGYAGTTGALVVAGGAVINKGLRVGATGYFNNIGVTGTINNLYFTKQGNNSINISNKQFVYGVNNANNIVLGVNDPASSINSTSSDNIGIGNQTFTSLNGYRNIAIGTQALYDCDAGSDNVAIGYKALYSVGIDSGIGENNVAVGSNALELNANCSNNVAIGYNAGYTSSGHIESTYVGSSSGPLTGYTGNICIGYNAGSGIENNSNIIIGNNSGTTSCEGTNNICIGHNVDPSSLTVSNEMTLGNTGLTMARTYAVIQTLNTTNLAGNTGTTGALIVNGGGAINKNLYVGGTAYFNNNVNVTGNLGVTATGSNYLFLNGLYIGYTGGYVYMSNNPVFTTPSSGIKTELTGGNTGVWVGI